MKHIASYLAAALVASIMFSTPICAMNYYGDFGDNNNSFFNFDTSQSNCSVTISAHCSSSNAYLSDMSLKVKDALGSYVAFNNVNGNYSATAIGGNELIKTNSAGSIMLSLPAGQYTLEAYETEYFKPVSAAIGLNIPEGVLTKTTVIEYEASSSSINISVSDEAGNAIPGASIQILDAFGTPMSFFDSDGEFIYMESSGKKDISITNSQISVSGLPDGKYFISVIQVPENYAIPDPSSVNIEKGELKNVDIICQTLQGSMTIINVDSVGNAIIGSACSLSLENGKVLTFTKVGGNEYKYDPIGTETIIKFETADPIIITGLTPDIEYTVSEVNSSPNYDPAEPQKIVLQNGVAGYVSLQTKRTSGSLTISVSDEITNEPLADFTYMITGTDSGGNKVPFYFSVKDSTSDSIYVYNEQGDISGVKTGDNGNIVIEGLPIGDIAITCKESPAGYVTDTNEIKKTISTSASTSCNISASKSNVAIEVRDENESPVANACIEIYNNSGELVLSSNTNAKGKILLSNIAAGSYTYRLVSAPDGFSYDPAVVEFVITPSGTAEGLSPLTLKKTKIQVSIGEQKGENSRENAVFALCDMSGNEISRALTSSSGIASFSGIGYGEYVIKQISAPIGYQISSNEIHISINEKYINEDVFYINGEDTLESTSETEAEITTEHAEHKKFSSLNIGDVFFIIIGILIALFAATCVVQLILKAKSNIQSNPEDNIAISSDGLSDDDVKIFIPPNKQNNSPITPKSVNIDPRNPAELKALDDEIKKLISQAEEKNPRNP